LEQRLDRRLDQDGRAGYGSMDGSR